MKKVWGLMEECGTYVTTGVMVDGGILYLRCFRCDVVSFVIFFSGVVELDELCVWVEV